MRCLAQSLVRDVHESGGVQTNDETSTADAKETRRVGAARRV